MATDPHAILRSKVPDLSRDFIDRLSTGEAWQMVYSLTRAPKTKPKPKCTICFTGFAGTEELSLRGLAEAKGFTVVSSVVKNLSILCTGLTPGPMKLDRAKAQDTIILSPLELEDYLANLPNGPLSIENEPPAKS